MQFLSIFAPVFCIIATFSFSLGLDYNICVSGDLTGCCSVPVNQPACQINENSVGVTTNQGCGKSSTAINYFYIQDGLDDYWSGCLGINTISSNCSDVTSFQGYLHVSAPRKDAREFSITVTVIS